MIPQINGAGPIIFIEDDAGRSLEYHERWKQWLSVEQRKDRGEPALNLQEIMALCCKIAAGEGNHPFYDDPAR